MNKEKTSMQMLIEEMESEFKHATTWSVKKSDIYPWITKAKYLLQKEQEQIKQAFDDGYLSVLAERIRLETDTDNKKYIGSVRRELMSIQKKIYEKRQ